MRMVDGCGRQLEVILLDRGGGPQQWIRATSRHGYLLGAGYYRRLEDALALVDVETLVEVIPLDCAS
jgi:hypothetical protein